MMVLRLFLSQHKDGRKFVIAYASRSLTKAESKELLAVVTFSNHFHQYLLGRQFHLQTDHRSLTWLTNLKNPEGRWRNCLNIRSKLHIDLAVSIIMLTLCLGTHI